MIKSKNKTPKYITSKGQSARSRGWFYLDYEWLEENLIRREQDFNKYALVWEVRSDAKNIFQIFEVTIGNAKITRKVWFHPVAPLIKYHQNISNSFCLGSL